MATEVTPGRRSAFAERSYHPRRLPAPTAAPPCRRSQAGAGRRCDGRPFLRPADLPALASLGQVQFAGVTGKEGGGRVYLLLGSVGSDSGLTETGDDQVEGNRTINRR